MHLQLIALTNVRQFESRTFSFLPGVNLLVGENGTGKTTLLRSIAAVLGPTGSRYETPILIDDDIKLFSRDLSIDAQISTSKEAIASYAYRRAWGGRARRVQQVDLPLLLIYGSNESTCSSFAAQRRRRQTERPREPMHLREEEWLYEEIEQRPSDVKDPARFGSSKEIRRFVMRVLSLFSPNFFDFGWIFEPYRCTIRQRESGPGHLDSRYRRRLANEILRYLDERKRPFRTGDQRTLVIDSSGYPIRKESRLRRWEPIPPFEELLRRYGDGDIPKGYLKNLIAEIQLTPRIRVDTRNGPLLLSQMSDGEKRLFSIFVDIARQLSISRDRTPVEEIPAIVLIDEIDVHLHPKWQRQIVPALEDLFPACQFIATTHSPFVVQGVDEERVQHLDRSLAGAFTDRGIEEIAAKVMGIEDHEVSPRYLEMLKAAREYFTLLETAEKNQAVGDEGAVERAKQEMDRLSARYARNPAYQAFLELNKNLRLGRGN